MDIQRSRLGALLEVFSTVARTTVGNSKERESNSLGSIFEKGPAI